MQDKKPQPGKKPVSLAPLTPDQALRAALQVKKADVDKLDAEVKAMMAEAKKRKKK